MTCYLLPINIVPRHSYRPQNLYPDCKNHAIPSLHRDSFLAYRDRFVAVLSSGNTTSPYCRAVKSNARAPKIISSHSKYSSRLLKGARNPLFNLIHNVTRQIISSISFFFNLAQLLTRTIKCICIVIFFAGSLPSRNLSTGYCTRIRALLRSKLCVP